jgi:gliding motility-associated-like protein
MDIGVPNFFTPNGDGFNDTWEIPFMATHPDARIWIYDRFGRLMTSYLYGDGGWDGTTNGKAAGEDTYWYVIKLDNNSRPMKGSLTIKR